MARWEDLGPLGFAQDLGRFGIIEMFHKPLDKCTTFVIVRRAYLVKVPMWVAVSIVP